MVAQLHDTGGLPIPAVCLVVAAAGFNARCHLHAALVELFQEGKFDAHKEVVVDPFREGANTTTTHDVNASVRNATVDACHRGETDGLQVSTPKLLGAWRRTTMPAHCSLEMGMMRYASLTSRQAAWEPGGSDQITSEMTGNFPHKHGNPFESIALLIEEE